MGHHLVPIESNLSTDSTVSISGLILLFLFLLLIVFVANHPAISTCGACILELRQAWQQVVLCTLNVNLQPVAETSITWGIGIDPALKMRTWHDMTNKPETFDFASPKLVCNQQSFFWEPWQLQILTERRPFNWWPHKKSCHITFGHRKQMVEILPGSYLQHNDTIMHAI